MTNRSFCWFYWSQLINARRKILSTSFNQVIYDLFPCWIIIYVFFWRITIKPEGLSGMCLLTDWFIGWLSGGDQGLLNSFFSSWSVEDITKHLPFVYNLSGSCVYSYPPAFQQWVLLNQADSPLVVTFNSIRHRKKKSTPKLIDKLTGHTFVNYLFFSSLLADIFLTF